MTGENVPSGVRLAELKGISDVSRQRTDRKTGAESRRIDFSQQLRLEEKDPAIGVAIVSERETASLADSLETLLAEAKGFTPARLEYRAESSIKLRTTSFSQPNDADVVVVTLSAPDADHLALLFASLRRAFPQRSVLATTIQPDAFDILQVLEMGAAICSMRRDGADLRRIRHWQRNLRARSSLPRPARGAAIRPGQLRRAPGASGGERDFRPQTWHIYWRRGGSGRADSRSRGRHTLFG